MSRLRGSDHPDPPKLTNRLASSPQKSRLCIQSVPAHDLPCLDSTRKRTRARPQSPFLSRLWRLWTGNRAPGRGSPGTISGGCSIRWRPEPADSGVPHQREGHPPRGSPSMIAPARRMKLCEHNIISSAKPAAGIRGSLVVSNTPHQRPSPSPSRTRTRGRCRSSALTNARGGRGHCRRAQRQLR